MLADSISVFVSYRREDTRHVAGRLGDLLQERFDRVFMDIDNIEPGIDFTEVIRRAVSECDVLLAIIGTQWTSLLDEQGERRLDNPHDWVVEEIRVALQRDDVRVVPVLVDGAPMPRRSELPVELAPMATRQALTLRYESFKSDAARLVAAIERMRAPVPPPMDGDPQYTAALAASSAEQWDEAVGPAPPPPPTRQPPMVWHSPTPAPTPAKPAERRRRRLTAGKLTAIALAALLVVGAGVTTLLLVNGRDGGGTATAGSAVTTPSSGGTGQTTGADLALPTPISSPPCNGQFVVFVGAAVTPGAYQSEVARLLADHPGSSYLLSELSCSSLRPRTSEGNSIYAVYLGPFITRAEACAARNVAGEDSYVKVLDNVTPPDQLPPC